MDRNGSDIEERTASAHQEPTLHPLHANLLAFPVALFTGAVLTDAAYLNTAHMQWSNFSAWLIAGGLLMGGLTLLWAIVSAVLNWRTHRGRRSATFAVVLGAACGVNFFNALIHSRDAWASVTELGLLLSALAALLALAAGWIGFSAGRQMEAV